MRKASNGPKPPSRERSSAKPDKHVREKIKQKFRELDNNGDGKLDLDELSELLQGAKKTRLSEKEVQILFKKVDKNNDGKVDFNEFVDYIWQQQRGGGDEDSDETEAATLEVDLPRGGGGLVLGGKLGNAVIKAGFVPKVKVGWRAIAINGKKLGPAALAQELDRCNRDSKRIKLTFELDEIQSDKINSDMESRRARAMKELLDVLGCSDLTEVSSLSETQRANARRDIRVQRLLVEAHAVNEAELLLGQVQDRTHKLNLELRQALEQDDHSEILRLASEGGLDPQDFLRKDGDGNVPLHLAKSELAAKTLLKCAPGAQGIQNIAGRNPLNERLMNYPDKVAGDSTKDMRELLCCDEKGICPALRLQGEDLKAARLMFPSWEDVSAALQSEPRAIVPALKSLGGDEWPGLLGFYLFWDAMNEGIHTQTSWMRLRVVWEVLNRLFQACLARHDDALKPVKELLKATKGPCCPPVDMRLPYRDELLSAMNEMQNKSGNELSLQYNRLEGKAAQWIKHELDDHLCDELRPDILVERGLKPRLRMDFELASGPKGSDELVPSWIKSESPDFGVIMADLTRVGMIGQSRSSDATFDMLRLGGMGDDTEDLVYCDDPDRMVIIRLYAAYLRGVCQGQQTQVTEGVRKMAGAAAVPGETMFARPEAKGFPRIVVKTKEALGEIHQELRAVGADMDNDVNIALNRSAAFVNDINGVTLVGKDPDELRTLYNTFADSTTLLRTKNTYRSHAITASNYRDIKLWPCVQTDVGSLLVEVQLILEDSYREKKWMHLPYAFLRGDFDWQYSTDGPSAEDFFQTGWRFYCGIEGSHQSRDKDKAKDAMIEAAKRGHLMARGLCRKEGWGKYARDNGKAMEDFTAAAESGKREAKCQLGIGCMNALTNVGRNRTRGFEYLKDAAQEGEVEAMYQIALYEIDPEEQVDWLTKAVRLGHARAARHPLMGLGNRTTVKLGKLEV